MIFELTKKETDLLEERRIPFDFAHDYSENEAFELLEQVRNIEVEYAQDYTVTGERLYYLYGDLADKIQSQIPEN